MSQEFDWENAEDDLVIHTAQAVAVYNNEKGDIVIRQERHWDENEDPFIVVPISAGPILVEKLQKLLAEAEAS